jgi:urease accessory protein
MLPSVRSLALAGSAGFALSLLSGLPASAHGAAGAGLMAGALHPLTGADHLLLLVGVGALAARVDHRLLWPALAGAVVGALFGAAGGWIPAGELLAALSVSALGVLLLAARRLRTSEGPLALSGAVVGAAVAVHALLHGREASGEPTWWIGAALAAATTVAVSALTLNRCSAKVSCVVAMVLGISGLALAFVPLA